MANAKEFGAVGDGVADDHEALQHTLEAGKGVLELGPGTYRLTRPVVMDLTRTGYGAILASGGTTRLLMDGPGPAVRIVGDHRGTAQPSSVQPQTWDRERFPTVRDVEILGRHPDAVGVELRKTLQCTISRVLIRNCRHAVHLVERNRNFILSDSHLYDNAEYGVFFDQCNLHQAIIHGNHISYNKRAGIRSFCGDVHNVQITGNDIEYNNHPGVDESPNGEPRGAEIWFEAPEGKISEVTLASNTIQATVQPGGANIRIHGSPNEPYHAVLISITGNVIGSQTRGVELRHAQRITITGNTIYDSRDLSLLATHCSGVSFAANTIGWRTRPEDAHSDGIRLEDCENCVLTGLVSERLCAGAADAGAGVTLVRCQHCSVSNSQLLDPFVRGVELDSCTACRVHDNTIIDRRTPTTMQHAIRVTGKSRNNLITNNLVNGGAASLAIPEGTATASGNVEVMSS